VCDVCLLLKRSKVPERCEHFVLKMFKKALTFKFVEGMTERETGEPSTCALLIHVLS